jgi:rhamnosyltransferase
MSCDTSNLALIVLTYNAASTISDLLAAVTRQTLKPDKILILDSSSTDKTLTEAAKYQCEIKVIAKSDFDHGSTRQLATQLIDSAFYIFLTQDALPANDNAFANLMSAFSDPKVGCVYGRQLPKTDADLLGSQVRLFYYPEASSIMQYADRETHGIIACFSSDSFAAYRNDALTAIGGFPEKTILCEDMYVTARMLMAGWKKAYQANALVWHSHNYTVLQNFKFTFDIGVFHAMNPWIRQNFRGIHFTGAAYALSELKCCFAKRSYPSLVKSVFNIAGKYVGYLLGLQYRYIPLALRKKISLCNFYWDSCAN